MARAFVITFQGDTATLDNYRKSLTKLGCAPGGPHPDPDCLFHWATDIENGFRVTDVWTDKPEFERFIKNKVGPVSAQLGMPEPQVTEIDVDAYLTAGS
jgi:hypothetical protein